MRKINLNFLPFINQALDITVYRRLSADDDSDSDFYYANLQDDNGDRKKYEISFQPKQGFDAYKIDPLIHHGLAGKFLYEDFKAKLPTQLYFVKDETKATRKIYFQIAEHPKGKNCIWIEPFFLKTSRSWGLLFDYRFIVKADETGNAHKLDKEILIQSGTLNVKGDSNLDYYLFKHSYYEKFLKGLLPQINQAMSNNIATALYQAESNQLDPKTYIFGNNVSNSSPYFGLTRNPPLEQIKSDVLFYFIYKGSDRDVAVSLLKGLRGESHPTTFAGMEKLFKVDFTNSKIKGTSIVDFTDEEIDKQIALIQQLNATTIPIIITASKKTTEDEQLYFRIKHKFTNAKMPCQVVTKDLVNNEYSLKYSLGNIGLQIFAKAGGKPWKMRPASNEYLIIGIGQSYRRERTPTGDIVEKNLTYSVLTDSSGIFKDIKVLGEAVDMGEDYYNQLVNNLTTIIAGSGYKRVSIHTPFRLSVDKILKKVLANLPGDIEVNVIVINAHSDFFGFDYSNNGLVPFESTFIQIGFKEFLVWFEGIQSSNPKITKRYGNPLLIKLWFTNREDNFKDFQYKNKLLQDCINLSGANWRGFKAKQLPVSVFYCQRIAEFISKFQEYNLPHIEIDNLNPWFL